MEASPISTEWPASHDHRTAKEIWTLVSWWEAGEGVDGVEQHYCLVFTSDGYTERSQESNPSAVWRSVESNI